MGETTDKRRKKEKTGPSKKKGKRSNKKSAIQKNLLRYSIHMK